MDRRREVWILMYVELHIPTTLLSCFPRAASIRRRNVAYHQGLQCWIQVSMLFVDRFMRTYYVHVLRTPYVYVLRIIGEVQFRTPYYRVRIRLKFSAGPGTVSGGVLLRTHY
jgi:hypothetical protein